MFLSSFDNNVKLVCYCIEGRRTSLTVNLSLILTIK